MYAMLVQAWILPRTAGDDLREAATAVSEELLRMPDVVCEVEDQGRLLQSYLDEVVLSSRRREQAEGIALRGHDGVSSLLPSPWWRIVGCRRRTENEISVTSKKP